MLRTLVLALLLPAVALAQDLVAVTWTGDVLRIDPTSGIVLQATSLFPVLNEVNAAARTPDGTWWVAADRGSRLVEVDPRTATLGVLVQTTLDARGLAVHPITGDLYAIGAGGDLYVVDTTTGLATLIGSGGSGGYQALAFGADGTFLAGNDDLFGIDPTTGVETLIGTLAYDIRGADFIFDRGLGTSYCGPAAANSAGVSARMAVSGDTIASVNQLWLGCVDLPLHSFGYFLTSDAVDFVPNPGGSQGDLCLGGSIGRLSNQIVNTGSRGWVSVQLDLTQVPTPMGSISVTAGATRHFSYWYRDANPGVTSNFANGQTITFD